MSMTDHSLIAQALGRFLSDDVAYLAADDILAALADDGAFTSSAAIWKSIAEDHRAELRVARSLPAALDVVIAAVRKDGSTDGGSILLRTRPN